VTPPDKSTTGRERRRRRRGGEFGATRDRHSRRSNPPPRLLKWNRSAARPNGASLPPFPDGSGRQHDRRRNSTYRALFWSGAYVAGRRDTPAVPIADALRSIIEGRAGTWGVYARHLGTGETVDIRADDVMPAQSSVKVCILLAYTKRVGLGVQDPDRRVKLLDEDHALGSGVLRYLAPGLSPTLDDLAWLMIVLSDNIATLALIRELGGREVVNSDMDELGLSHLRLRDSLLGSSYMSATPQELAEVYTHLDEHARRILYQVDKVDFLVRRIPHAPNVVDHGLQVPVRAYTKAGWGAECVDAGLFETDECSWIIAAMAKDLPDLRHRPDDEGPRTLADIGETIYRAWGP